MKRKVVFLIAIIALLFLTGCGDNGQGLTIDLDLPEEVSLVDWKLDSKKLTIGSEVEFLITPPTGKELKELKINGVDQTLTVVNNRFTTEIVSGLEILVTFKDIGSSEDPDTYTVTLGEGLYAVDELTNLVAGTKFYIYINVPDEKEVDQFKVDENVIDLEGLEYYYLTVTGNHNVTVTFKDIGTSEDPDTYTVTWKNYDGTVLETDTGVAFATMPKYDGDIPTKPGDYYFKGWSPNISIVTESVEYTAIFVDGATLALDYVFIDLGEGYSIYGYYGQDNFVFVPKTYKEKSVISIEGYAFYNNKKIKNLTLPDSLIEIKEYAFAGCSNLQNVTFGSGLKKIGEAAFKQCKTLETIRLPEGFTTLGEAAFSLCSKVDLVVLPNSLEFFGFHALYDVDDVAFIEYENGIYAGSADNNYLVLVEPKYSTIDTIKIHDNCKIIGNKAFHYSSSLKTIDFGQGVQIIGDFAFAYCSQLGSITIPKTVTKIGDSAFSRSSITSLGFADNSRIKSIGSYAFTGCANITTLYLSEGLEDIGKDVFTSSDISNKTTYENAVYLGSTSNAHLVLLNACNKDIENVKIHAETKIIAPFAFDDCNSLTEVIIPSNVKYIGEGAFRDCDGLERTKVDLANSTYSSPNDTAIIHRNTRTLISGLKNATIPKDVRHIGNFAFANTKITSITLPDGLISIGESAFEECGELASISIPDTVTTIKPYAFASCTMLTSVKLPNKLPYLDQGMFRFCIYLTSIDIPNSVSYIGREAFLNCLDLETLDMGNSLTVIGTSAFSGCQSLRAISIPNHIKALEYQAFHGCSGALSISIGSGVVSLGEFVFSGCDSATTLVVDPENKVFDSRDDCNGIIETKTNKLVAIIKTIEIPESVTIIGNGAFYKCDTMESIKLGDNIKTIEEYAFAITTFKSIILGKGLTYIGERAFFESKSLTSIIIPKSVQNISYDAFRSCNNLTIYAEATEEPAYWTYSWNYSKRPVYWYSETPNYDGAHWRYVNGTPVVWESQ
ncbi:MAG: leucine-rich repeat protein [Acholeplasmataceae bacterium]|jgi:hypothetical protein